MHETDTIPTTILPEPELIAAFLNLSSVRRGEDPRGEEVEGAWPGAGARGRAALGDLGRLLRGALRGETSTDALPCGLNALFAACPVTYSASARGLGIAPLDPADAALLPALGVGLWVARGMETGEWSRLRQCAGCSCVFYDASRSGRRVWCSMETCGNRAKVNRFRGRELMPDAPAGGCACGDDCACGAVPGTRLEPTQVAG